MIVAEAVIVAGGARTVRIETTAPIQCHIGSAIQIIPGVESLGRTS